jgi:hypothetical protein
MTSRAIKGSPWRDFYVHMLHKGTILCARTIVTGFILLFGFQFGAPAWADSVLYSTSFENPPFTTGSIVGQDGWNVFGPGAQEVENFFADTGSQAVFVDGGAVSQTGPYNYTATTGPLVDLSADLAIFGSSTQSEWQFAATGPGLIGYLGGINIQTNGDISAITGGTSDTDLGTFTRATTFDGSAWVNVNLLFDLATQTYDISVGGVLLASDVPFCGGNGACTGANLSTFGDGFFDTFGGGNDSAYMDNYSVTLITPTPEPSMALPLVLLLGMGLALRRKLPGMVGIARLRG